MMKTQQKMTYLSILHLIYSMFLRWAVSLGSYSGQGKYPMYGDYEAQRHWQEITVNLPMDQWYKNSTVNNLLYWGLDYPPLTAYHSWICGQVAKLINPEWVALFHSRGFESDEHKFFMRATVFVADLLVFYTAVLLVHTFQRRQSKASGDGPESPQVLFSYSMFFLVYPGIILIDYGHFQYNNVSLGLFIMSVAMLDRRQNFIGTSLFCAALNYKQMELYHALPMFCYFVGKIFKLNITQGVKTLVILGVAVISTFAVVWAPFLNVESATNVVSRVFPVGRGLYEDKVANIWCAVSPFFKFKKIFENSTLVKMCAVTTLLTSIPSCLHLTLKPTMRNLKLTLFNVSLCFFLFSYHVHEKSILIPAVTACFLYCKELSLPVSLFLHFSVVSMSPLLFKDGLALQTIVMCCIFIAIVRFEFSSTGEQAGSFLSTITKTKTSKFAKKVSTKQKLAMFKLRKIILTNLTRLAWLVSFLLMLLPLVKSPPARFPDIFALFTSIVSCGVFLLCSAIFHYVQLCTDIQI